MGRKRIEIRDAALELPIEERLRLAQELWESVERAEASSLPDWQQVLLRQRLEAAQADPDSSTPWEEVKARLWPGL